MSDAARPPLAVRRPDLVRAGRVVLIVLGWAVATWLLGMATGAVATFLLLMALVLVPVGLVYGVVIRAVLLRRRRAAQGAITGTAIEGSPRDRLPAQRIDRWLAALLLVNWTCLGVVWVMGSVLEVQGPLLDSLAGTVFGMLLEVLVAIPVAAVLATRQATDRPGMEAEAAVLAAGGPDAHAIRLTRTLSWIAYVVSSVVAVGTVAAFFATTLR